jgi:nicotinamide mononucleotide transporter
MNPIEIAGVVFTVIYVLLAIYGNPWCWPAGIIGSAFYIYYNIDLKFYQDAILQFYYVLAGFYGWYYWVKNKGAETSAPIVNQPAKQLLPVLIIGIIIFPATGYVFHKLGNNKSYIDAFTTVFSFIATWLTARKVLQNWWLWMLVNSVLVYQYVAVQSYPTAGLYVFLTVMSVLGYYQWKKKLSAA